MTVSILLVEGVDGTILLTLRPEDILHLINEGCWEDSYVDWASRFRRSIFSRLNRGFGNARWYWCFFFFAFHVSCGEIRVFMTQYDFAGDAVSMPG